MKRLGILLVLATVGINGCVPAPTTPMKAVSGGTHRVSVVRIDVIQDDLAYGNRRGIYEIIDSQTDQTFIGISGIGITEVGDHRASKSSRVTDER